jgi:hypothetical protein
VAVKTASFRFSSMHAWLATGGHEQRAAPSPLVPRALVARARSGSKGRSAKKTIDVEFDTARGRRGQEEDPAATSAAPSSAFASCSIAAASPTRTSKSKGKTSSRKQRSDRSAHPRREVVIDVPVLVNHRVVCLNEDPAVIFSKERARTLLDACTYGTIDVVRELLDTPRRGMFIDLATGALGEEPATPLLAAVRAGRADSVELLVDAGADISCCDDAGRNALMLAAASGDLSMIDPLLSRGAEPSLVQASNGWTALMFACASGHHEWCERLLTHLAPSSGGDFDARVVEMINHIDFEGCSALSLATDPTARLLESIDG